MRGVIWFLAVGLSAAAWLSTPSAVALSDRFDENFSSGLDGWNIQGSGVGLVNISSEFGPALALTLQPGTWAKASHPICRESTASTVIHWDFFMDNGRGKHPDAEIVFGVVLANGTELWSDTAWGGGDQQTAMGARGQGPAHIVSGGGIGFWYLEITQSDFAWIGSDGGRHAIPLDPSNRGIIEISFAGRQNGNAEVEYYLDNLWISGLGPSIDCERPPPAPTAKDPKRGPGGGQVSMQIEARSAGSLPATAVNVYWIRPDGQAEFRGTTHYYTRNAAFPFTDSGLALSEFRTYRLRAVNPIGESEFSAPITIQAPSPPSAPLRVEHYQGEWVVWDGPNESGGIQILRYEIFRENFTGDRYFVGSSTSTAFKINAALHDVAWYRVRAVNAASPGPLSSATCAMGAPAQPLVWSVWTTAADACYLIPRAGHGDMDAQFVSLAVEGDADCSATDFIYVRLCAAVVSIGGDAGCQDAMQYVAHSRDIFCVAAVGTENATTDGTSFAYLFGYDVEGGLLAIAVYGDASGSLVAVSAFGNADGFLAVDQEQLCGAPGCAGDPRPFSGWEGRSSVLP